MKKACIIGAGVAGCVSAYLLQKKGWDVTIIEKSSFIGGGNRTFFSGGHPYTFGPHHFLSPFEDVYKFVDSFVKLRPLKQLCYTYVEGDQEFYHYPIHEDDLERMSDKEKIYQELKDRPSKLSTDNFENFWKDRVGPTLYKKYIESYSKKMWQIDSNKTLDHGLDETVKQNYLQTGTKYVWTNRFNCYPEPLDGYNSMFDKLVKDCKVLTNTCASHYDVENKTIEIKGEKLKWDLIVSTISPDMLMDYAYGKLPYVGRDFIKIVLPIEFAFPEDVHFVYYANEEKYTRVVEYKKMTNYKSNSTILGIEIPTMERNPLYPMPIAKEVAKAKKYLENLPNGVLSVGRMGTYKYVDLDDIVKDCIDLFKDY